MRTALIAAGAVVLLALAAFFWRSPSRSTPLEPATRHEALDASSAGGLEVLAEPAQGAGVALPSSEPPRHAVSHPSVPLRAEPGPTVIRMRLLSSYDETPIVGERVALSDARATSWGTRP
ncbi:MAG TPA: hypothetical protein VMS76_11590, partial [Planctomycetota bacterium]|nr:hypothetical protein [Planctomycetota bacterium]